MSSWREASCIQDTAEPPDSQMSYSLNSLKRGYIRDYMGWRVLGFRLRKWII